MNTLCDDLLSFDGILRYLSIQDVCSLSCVNRVLNGAVTQSCRRCRRVGVVHSRDIHHVLDRARFSSLETFPHLLINNRMHNRDLRSLFERWPAWSSCVVHTSKHSRRAIKTFLARVLKIRRLTIVVDSNPNREYIVSLRTALHACKRRNSETLCDISLHTGVVSPPKSLILAMGALRHVTLEWAIVCSDQVYFAVTALARHTIEVLRIWNSSTVQPFGYAKFLVLLSQWQRLKTLDLRGPIVDPLCDRFLDTFCRTSALNVFAVNCLCAEHVVMLRATGLHTLYTRLMERVTPEWIRQFPRTYNIVS